MFSYTTVLKPFVLLSPNLRMSRHLIHLEKKIIRDTGYTLDAITSDKLKTTMAVVCSDLTKYKWFSCIQMRCIKSVSKSLYRNLHSWYDTKVSVPRDGSWHPIALLQQYYLTYVFWSPFNTVSQTVYPLVVLKNILLSRPHLFSCQMSSHCYVQMFIFINVLDLYKFTKQTLLYSYILYLGKITACRQLSKLKKINSNILLTQYQNFQWKYPKKRWTR